MENEFGLIAAESSGVERILVPEDTYIAQCVKIWDLGTQVFTFEGKEVKSRKVQIVFELLDYENPESENGVKLVSKEFTLSLNKQAYLRPFLESWRGRKFTEAELKGFDIIEIHGALCNLQILHKTSKKGRVSAEISSVQKFKGSTDLEPKTELEIYSIKKHQFNFPESMPDFFRNKILESEEFKEYQKEIGNENK